MNPCCQHDTCVRCGADFHVPEWCFHRLCSPCFREYDAFKMGRRLASDYGGYEDEKFEKWLAANPKQVAP